MMDKTMKKENAIMVKFLPLDEPLKWLLYVL
jgi:hypothetical protein